LNRAYKPERRPVSLAAEAKFRARLAALGATLLDPWLGAHEKHRVLCAVGHECYPTPGTLRNGAGPCRTCARKDPATAYAAFRKRLEELGATLLEPGWLGAMQPHRVICGAGHACNPRPAGVQQGRGICRTCAGNNPAAAEGAFRARLAEYGAEMLGPYRGNKAKVHVRCGAGHDCYPAPGHVLMGHNPCRTCVRKDPIAAEAAFRARLAELGAVPFYRTWRGTMRPHHVRCACGRDCYPRPNSVQQGDGFCVTCAKMSHTVFYVLEHESMHLVKFGISSGAGRRRLSDHRVAGFTTVHLLVSELADGVPQVAERAVLAALALAGESPRRGREYFDRSCLALILDVAEGWLGIREPASIRPVVAREWVQDMLFAA
jgi:single CXXC unit